MFCTIAPVFNNHQRLERVYQFYTKYCIYYSYYSICSIVCAVTTVTTVYVELCVELTYSLRPLNIITRPPRGRQPLFGKSCSRGTSDSDARKTCRLLCIGLIFQQKPSLVSCKYLCENSFFITLTFVSNAHRKTVIFVFFIADCFVQISAFFAKKTSKNSKRRKIYQKIDSILSLVIVKKAHRIQAKRKLHP